MAGSLLPEPKQQFLNDIGEPLFGGKIFTYAAGTLTPKATYQDQALTIANTNPVIANARGEVVMYGSGSYRIILQDLFGNTIYDRDNISTYDEFSDLLRSELASSTGASLVGYIQAGLGAVGWTVQDKLRESVSVTDFMSAAERADALTGTPTMDVIAAFEKAYAASNVLIIPPGNYLLSRAFKINKNNYSVLGAGYNRSIMTMTAASTVAIEVAGEANVTGLRLSDFKIQGNATNIGGIKLGSASFYCAIPIFENLNIWDFSLSAGPSVSGYGIQLYQVQNATFHNCWVYRNRHAYQRPNAGYCTSTKISGKSSYAGEGYVGLFLDGQADDIYLEDVIFEGNNNSAIIVTENAVASGRGSSIYISSAYFEENNLTGLGVISIKGGAGTYQDHTLVVDKCNFAVNNGIYIALDRAIATVKNSKIIPSQITTTANTTARFENNSYANAGDYFVGYKSLLGNITATDKTPAATSKDVNQVNYVNAITFPSVPRLVTDPNTLDDYQERVAGQWVPVATGFGGVINTIAGQYIKIGRMVHLQISITGTSLTATWGTSGVSIPFACALSTSGALFNAALGTSAGGVYLDAATDNILLPTLPASNAVLLINVSYAADE